MRHFIKLFVVSAVAMGFLTACGPAKVERFENIGANETAFVVPLEGAGKSNQEQFMSVEYLNSAKVATKRISLSLREHSTGRMYWDYEWIPTVKVIKVNRQPVTREWTGKEDTGTAGRDEALWVESFDSIGFGVGVNTTALVREEDAAQFLYYFAGKPLAAVVDENVRGKINSILSREFAAHDLEAARGMKNQIFKIAAEETVAAFKTMGVTITNLGLAEGLVYADEEIQKAINEKFKAEMDIQIQEQKNKAQVQINERNVAIAKAKADGAIKKANGEIKVQEAKRLAADEFAKSIDSRTKQVELEIKLMNAKARLVFAENIQPGVLPSNILPQGSSMLFGLDSKIE